MQINTSRKWHHLACDPDDLKRFTFSCTLMIALWDAATRGHWRKESVSMWLGVCLWMCLEKMQALSMLMTVFTETCVVITKQTLDFKYILLCQNPCQEGKINRCCDVFHVCNKYAKSRMLSWISYLLQCVLIQACAWKKKKKNKKEIKFLCSPNP